MSDKFIKTNRTFTFIRNYSFLITLIVAIGGLFQPKLGLLVIFIMLGLIVTSLFNAKYWCGNVCPHGSYFDKLILPLSRNRKIPSIFKSRALSYTVFAFFLYNFSRKILAISKFWADYSFLDRLGTVFSTTYLVVLIVGSILGIFINPRTWCQVCPMGSMEKISYRFGRLLGLNRIMEKKIKISDRDLCKNCGLCYRVCPMQIRVNEVFDENNQISDINCIKCNTCVNNCPMKILSLEKASK